MSQTNIIVPLIKGVNNRSSFAFELVHSDVWGRSRVPSVKGFTYFLIFVDDFLSHNLVVFTKREVKSFCCYLTFFNEIKNQFSISLCVLRTDNALKYVKNDVSFFCSKNEIIHQLFCSYIPTEWCY